jgi:hypothetical protein
MNPHLKKVFLSHDGRTCFLELLICMVFPIVPALAGGTETWIPARWPGGPLELELRARDKTMPADPELRETIRQWYDPATLDLLKGTPINCLLLTWSAGRDSEAEIQQRKLVQAYAREARKRGIAVVGLMRPWDSPSSLTESALEAGLDGFAMEGDSPGSARSLSDTGQALRARNSAAVILAMTPWGKLTRSLDILAAADAVAPGLRELAEGVAASPSSEPWIDSNIWLVRALRSWGGPRPVWLAERIAANAAPVDYLRAIADAAAGGGRWVIALSDALRQDLKHGEPKAVATWHGIATYLKFQQEHTEWYSYPSMAVCGFIQDGSGKNRELSAENLNLTVRRRVPLRIIERSELSAAALADLRVVHGIDMIQPTQQERKILSAFAENGGLVLAGPAWKQTEIPRDQDYAIVPTGRGRVAVYRDEWPEPASMAKDLVSLLGLENLGVRLFRSSSLLSHVSTGKSGSRVIIQLINYASYPAESVLVRVDGEFRSARFYTPESAVENLTLESSDGRIETTIPGLSVYGVLVLEK